MDESRANISWIAKSHPQQNIPMTYPIEVVDDSSNLTLL